MIRYLSQVNLRRKLFLGAYVAMGAAFVLIQYSGTALALTAEQKRQIDSGVYYYGDGDTASNTKTCSTATTTDTTTATGLSADIAAAINKLKPTYMQASETTHVPWQLLAAVHYRESNNSQTQDMQAGNPFGGPYTQDSTDYANYGYPKNLEESVVIAAKHLITSSHSGVVMKPIDVPSPDPEAVKDALFSYNGRADAYAQQAARLGFNPTTQPYEGSPYVMNEFDAKHTDMGIITHDHGGVDGIDHRLGAFTVYSRLGGGTGSDSGPGCTDDGGGAVAGDAIKTAISYAWPDYHPANYVEEKAAYKAAILAARAKGEYTGGDYDAEHVGIDCGAFVTRVMRDSGVDPTYNQGNGNTIIQRDYLRASAKWERITPSSSANLHPGDVAINDHHTYMFVGPVSSHPDFHGDSASASWSGESGVNWRAPMASTASDFGDYEWYRLKG